MDPESADPVVALKPPGPAGEVPRIEPGGELTLVASVHNPGGIVEEYALQVLGVPAPWTTLDPPALSAMPGETHEVRLTVRPPRDPSTPSGPQPIGLRVVSQESPEYVGVGETDVHIGGVHDLEAQLVAVRDRARWTGRYRLELTNRGSEPAALNLTADDPKQGLAFALAPATITVQPGQEATAFLQLRANKPKLVGQVVRHGFALTRTPISADPAARAALAGKHDGSFEQLPVLPRAAIAAVAIAAVGAVLLFTLVLKPDDTATAASRLGPPATSIGAIRANSATEAELEWRSNPYAKEYVVEKVGPPPAGSEDASSRTKAKAVPVLDSKTVEGNRNAFVWGDLKPRTENCFRLVAKNDAGSSVPSDVSCVTTPAAEAEEGDGESPGAGTEPSGEATASNGTGTPETVGTDATGETGTTDPTIAPTGDVLDGTFIVLRFYARTDDTIQATARAEAARIVAEGVDVEVIDTALTALPLVPGDGYALVVGGFADAAAANAQCRIYEEAGYSSGCFAASLPE